MVAAVDLMKRGYEVFRALSPACSCDLIALGPFGALRIEVRTGKKSLITGNLNFSRNEQLGGAGKKTKRSETDLDHYAVVVHHGTETEVIYFPELMDKGEPIDDGDGLELGVADRDASLEGVRLGEGLEVGVGLCEAVADGIKVGDGGIVCSTVCVTTGTG